MPETVRLGVIVPSVNIVVEEWYPASCRTGSAFILPGC